MNSFQLGSSAKIFKVLTFELILFTLSSINLGEKTRNFFSVEPFFCMSQMKCLSKCLYSKEPVLLCLPVTLILPFIPISGFLQIYPFTENQENQEPTVQYYFERDIKLFVHTHQKLWLFSRRYILFLFINIGKIIFVSVVLKKAKILYS